MLYETARAALLDIEHHIELATRFVAGSDYKTFRHYTRMVYAVTRCLEIISEATRRLPEEMKTWHPSIAWKNTAAAGNVYRHDYEDVEPKLVWDTVQLALPPLAGGSSTRTGGPAVTFKNEAEPCILMTSTARKRPRKAVGLEPGRWI